jgi:hypothetical protein
MSYQLGSVDSDGRTDLYADPREDAARPRFRGLVASLIALWNKYYLNEEGIPARRAAFARFMAKTPQPTRVQIKHVDADGVEADFI